MGGQLHQGGFVAGERPVLRRAAIERCERPDTGSWSSRIAAQTPETCGEVDERVLHHIKGIVRVAREAVGQSRNPVAIA
jgi:hypothetical protein